MKKVKIYGAGSIGNHLAYASRQMGWDVLICDIDEKALERTKNQIYPARYGKWDEAIRLSPVKDVPKEDFDIVIIGTPPDSHLQLAIKTLKEEKPEILLIEKPLCTPSLEGAQALYELAKKSGTKVLVGYNHALGKNTIEAEKVLKRSAIGTLINIHAGFQEHWGGIFKAHPWLAGPQDSYLGFSEKGGGASGEHSHAINIWQHFSRVLGFGRVSEVLAFMDFVKDENVAYDRLCNINVKTEKGLTGTIIQDVVTEPPKKHVRIQGSQGFVEWHVNHDRTGDAVTHKFVNEETNAIIVPKKRPDDFRWEAEHLDKIIKDEIGEGESPISLERGLDTMMVVAAAHISHNSRQVVMIDYDKGYLPEAISPA